MTLPPVALLAGGRATRLRPITTTIPKALIEVAGRPFIHHQFDLLKRAGIERIVLCVGYLGEMIEETLGDGSRFGLHLMYAYDGDEPKGTGGALKNALPLLGDEFFVLYGDTYLDIDYAAVYETFRASSKPGLMTVFHNENRLDKSNVIFENGQIIAYDKQQQTPRMQYIDYGLGLLKASVIAPITPPIDLAEIYTDLVQQSQLAGCEVFQRFYEIGTPQALAETERFLHSKGT